MPWISLLTQEHVGNIPEDAQVAPQRIHRRAQERDATPLGAPSRGGESHGKAREPPPALPLPVKGDARRRGCCGGSVGAAGALSPRRPACPGAALPLAGGAAASPPSCNRGPWMKAGGGAAFAPTGVLLRLRLPGGGKESGAGGAPGPRAPAPARRPRFCAG